MCSYKESGIPYVGKIPKHWNLKKNKRCFLLNKKIVGQNFGDFDLLSLTKKGIIYKDINNTFGKTPESYETYQSVKAGQLVMCLFDLDISAVFSGISPYDGMISPAYKVYDCKSIMHNKYAGYWFDFCFDGRKYMSYSKSLRYVVNSEDFNDISIIVPPLAEQQQIANFLDEKISEIDNAIVKTKETIEDYKKLKQSLITKSVTQGINGNKVVDSSIEWLGKVNYEYDVCTMKRICKVNQGLQIPQSERFIEAGENRYVYLTVKYLNNIDNSTIVEYIENPPVSTLCKEDDILMSRTGSTGVAITNVSGCFHNNFFKINYNKNLIQKEYLIYYLSQDIIKKYLNLLAGTTTIPDLNHDAFYSTPLVLPNINEQKEIVKYLDEKCNEIDKLIKNKEKIIHDLENYKKSVVYEYVTGKKEVK